MSMDTVIHPAPSTRDALEELRADHRRIGRVLADCERMVSADMDSSQADRSALVARLGALLLAHLRVLHDVFEPALQLAGEQDGAGGDDHALLAQLAALSAAEPQESGFGDALHAVSAGWRAHVEHAEGQQFVQAAQAAQARGVDMLALGAAIAQRRAQVLGDQGVD